METQSQTKTKKPWYSIFGIEFLIVFLLLFALVIFIYAARKVFILQDTGFDNRVFNAIKPFINPGMTRVMEVITFLGKHTLLIPLNIALIIFFIYKKERWFAARITALSISS